MANPYSLYTGTRIQAVPAGYLTATGKMAESMQKRLAGLGSQIGAGIAKYYENKEEDEQKEAILGAHLFGQNLKDKATPEGEAATEGEDGIPELPGLGDGGVSQTEQNVSGDELREWVGDADHILSLLKGEKPTPGMPALPGLEDHSDPVPGMYDEPPVTEPLPMQEAQTAQQIEKDFGQQKRAKLQELAAQRFNRPEQLPVTGPKALPFGKLPGKLTEPLPTPDQGVDIPPLPGVDDPSLGTPPAPAPAARTGGRQRRSVHQNMNEWIEKYGKTANQETIQNAYEIIKGYSDSDTARKANRLRRKTLKQGLEKGVQEMEKGGLDIQKLQGELDQMKDGEVKTMSIPGAPNYLFAKPPGQKGWNMVQVPKAAIPVTQAQADAANKKMANHVGEDGKKKPIEYHWIPDINNPGEYIIKSIKEGADPTALFRFMMGEDSDAIEPTPDKKKKKSGVIQYNNSPLNPNFDPNKK